MDEPTFMYRRLTYLSNRVPGLTDDLLVDRVVLPSRSRNLEAGITSCLWTDGAHFFQLLEGPEAAVVATLARIVANPRHQHLRIVSNERADGLVFRNESLKLVLPSPGRTDEVERTMGELIELMGRAGGGTPAPTVLTSDNVAVEAFKPIAASRAGQPGKAALTGAKAAVDARRAPLVVHVLTRLTCLQGV